MNVTTVKLTNWHNPPHAMINLYVMDIDGISYNYSYPNQSYYPYWTSLEEVIHVIKSGDTGYSRNVNRNMWTLPNIIIPLDIQNPIVTIKRFFQTLMLQ